MIVFSVIVIFFAYVKEKKIVVENKMFDFNVGGKVGVASVFADEILTREELDALEMNEGLLK